MFQVPSGAGGRTRTRIQPPACQPNTLLPTDSPWVLWVTREETWEGLTTKFLLPTTCLLALLRGKEARVGQGLVSCYTGGCTPF